jgi:hypothetical protein
MSKIEIRQRKKMMIPFLLICVLLFLITGLGIFLTEKYKDDTTKKISFLIGVVIFVYFTYPSVIKLLKNQPIIVIEKDLIVLNTKQLVTIRKSEIEHIDVTYVEETGYFLNIKIKDTTHETNISWLDKTPDEIKKLIEAYME